jgi:hypothetical protein
MPDFAHNLHLFLRAQRILAQARLALAARQAIWLVLGLAALVLAFVMLNVTAFLALKSAMGSVYAALTLFATDCVFGALCIILAVHLKPPRDIILTQAESERAAQALLADIRAIQTDMTDLRDDIANFRGRFWETLRQPLGAAAVTIAAPLLSSLVGMLRGYVRRKRRRRKAG